MFFQIIFWAQAGMKSGETHLYNQNIKAQVFPNLDLFKILFVSKLAWNLVRLTSTTKI